MDVMERESLTTASGYTSDEESSNWNTLPINEIFKLTPSNKHDSALSYYCGSCSVGVTISSLRNACDSGIYNTVSLTS